MNKEELEKEADEYVTRTNNNDCTIEAYLAGAEPREKQIQALSKRCLQLQQDKGELIDEMRGLEDKVANLEYLLEGRDNEIDELQEQIEKTKSCRSCEHDNHCNHRVCDKSLPFWELRR